MKKLLFTAFTLIAGLLNAQLPDYWQKAPKDTTSIEFCGANTEYVSKMNDAYSSYRAGSFDPHLADPFVFTPQATFPIGLIEHCGSFNLYYADYLFAPGAGFADPTSGATRRNTMCAVLNYIESTIQIPTGVTIDIYIDRSFTTGNNPYMGTNSFFAFAGPQYPPNFSTTQGIYDGAFYDHVVSGVDPDPNNYDMAVTVNFDRIYIANGNYYSSFYYYEDHTNSIGTCKIDLYSVLLHEITHGMGFLSLVTEDGTHHAINGNSGATYNNAYSLFDANFIYKGNILTGTFTKLVDTSVPGSPVIAASVLAAANPLRSADLWLYNNAAPLNQPIYSGDSYWAFGVDTDTTRTAPRSLVSHLGLDLTSFYGQSQYSPGYRDRYVMGPFIDFNEYRRFYTNAELRCLLALGYSLNPTLAATTYGNTITTNTPPYRTNPATKVTESGNHDAFTEQPTFDFTIINNNSPTNLTASTLTMSIPGLPNIVDNEADPISIMPNSLFGIRGVSSGGNNHNLLSINPAGTVVTYTPQPGFLGIAQYGFWLWDGKERGAFKTVTIDVQQGTYIPPHGSELVINGGYEDGTEVRTTTNAALPYTGYESNRQGEYYEGAQFAGGHPYPYRANGWGPIGAGVPILNSQNLCNTTNGYNPEFGMYTTSIHATTVGNGLMPVHTIPANNERYDFHSGYYPFSPSFMTLMDSLYPTKYYILEFDISFEHDGGLTASTHVGMPYTISLDAITNPTDTVWWAPHTYFTTTYSDTVRAITQPGNTSGYWQHIVDTFEYCGTHAARYLRYMGPAVRRTGIDNFSIRQDTTRQIFDTVNIHVSTHSICEGDSITLTAVPNHVPMCPVTYIWNPGQDTAQSITVAPNDTTVYYLTAIYSNLTLHDTDTIVVHPLPNMVVTPNNPTQCTGSTTLTASGANTYLWSANAGSATTNTVTVSPTSTTTYTVTGNTTFGCKDSVITTVTVSSPPSVSVIPTATTVCSGSPATLTASGATTYSWTPSTGLSSTTGANVTATPSVTTTYTVQGTAAGCSASVTSTVTVIPSGTVTITPPRDTICYGQVTTLTASTGASSYSWSDNTGVIATTNTVTVSPTASITTYTLNTTGSFGCPNLTYTVNVYVYGGPTLTVTPSSTVICTTVPASSVTLTASGGVTTYTWDPPGGLSGIHTPTVSASPTVTTTYTVSNQEPVRGCKNWGYATVTVVPTLTVTVTPSPSFTICNGASTTLTASGATTYSWTPSTGLSATTGSVVTAHPTSPTAYTVTGTTSGCSSTSTFTVTINPLPSISVTPVNPQMCLGSPLTFTATGASTYTLTPPGTSFTSTISVNPTNTVTPTSYTISGTNAAGCQNQTVKTVTVNPVPTITVSPTSTSICNGVHQPLTAGGAGVSGTYSWTPSTGLSATTGTAVTASPTVTTTYTVTGTTVNTCTANATSAITVIVVPTAVSPTSPTYCVGSPTQLIATGATTYSWTPSTGLSATTGSVVTSTPTSTVPITYTVTGTANGCTANATTTVSIAANTCMSATKKIVNDTSIATNTTNFGLTPFTYSVTSVAIMGNVTITTGTTTIACNDVRIAPGKLITVKSGATLNIAWSYLHSCATCGSGMWQGIYVENGGKLTVSGGSRIEDADQAVYTQTWTSGTGIPDIQISQSIFNRNRTGVYLNLNGNPNNMQAAGASNIIDNSVFTCRDLSGITVATTTAICVSKFNAIKADVYNSADSLTTTKAGTRSTYGVRLNTASSATYPYIIGEPGATGSGGSGKVNIFDNLDYGVYSRSSYYAVKNCQFQNSKGNNSGAMTGHGINSSDANLSVGCFQLTTGVANEGCVFKNLLRGIHVQTNQKNYIRHNTFDNDTTSTTFSSGSNKGEYAMYLKPNGSFSATTTVDSNSINNCAIGIHINRSGSYAATGITVTNNTITAVGTTLKYCTKGIFLEDVIGHDSSMTAKTYLVKQNTITNINEKAIHASNVRSGLQIICNNELSLKYQTSVGTITNGTTFDVIRLDNCRNSYTEWNKTIRTSNGNTSFANEALTGIYINNFTLGGKNNVIRSNDIQYLGSSVVWEGNNPTGTSFARNTMKNGKYFMYMNQTAAFNGQPSTSDNYWGTTGYTNQTVNNSGSNVNTTATFTVYTGSPGSGITRVPTSHGFVFPSPPYTNGSTAGNGFFTTTTPPASCIAPECTDPCGGGGSSLVAGGDGSEMMMMGEANGEEDQSTDISEAILAIVNDTTESASYDAQRKWVNTKWAFETIFNSSDHYANNETLHSFYVTMLSEPIGRFTQAEAYLDNGEYTNALNTLNAITPQNSIEQYLLYVYNMQLAGLLDSEYSYSTSEMNSLYGIASECERNGGPAVRNARALYNNITSAYTPFEDDCSEMSEGRLARKETTNNHSKFNLYPNPSNGELTVEFDYIKQNDKAEVIIYSMDGKQLSSFDLTIYSNTAKFSLKDYQNGVYICKLVKNGIALTAERLVIMK